MHREAVEHLSRSDEILRRIIDEVGEPEIPRRALSPYESLVRSVVYQQLSGKAATSILAKVVALFPASKIPAPKLLLAMPDRKLRAAGLSKAKTRAMKAIARAALSGDVPTRKAIEKMTDEEIVGKLTAIHGVGPWTVNMMLIFTLGRPDVWPVSDYGVRKGFAVAYGHRELPTPKELIAHGEKWRPHRSVAAWYMWRVLDLEKDKAPPKPAPKRRQTKR